MILTVIDHASNYVPPDINLGIDPALLETHIAWDIGAKSVGDALGYPVYAATVSRLVIDMNRDLDAAALIPQTSDGYEIPGNIGDCSDRIARLYLPYHAGLAERITRERPCLIVSLHSFTPRLQRGPPRPWHIGVLYNQDDRAARIALPLLMAQGLVVGDQEPYSGKQLNATMNRHAEAAGIAYLGLEVRQDLIATPDSIAHWADVLAPVIDACAQALATPSEAI
jgi:predicted N-formylglutamate amidohydrolase